MNNAPITVVGNLTRDPELRFTNSGMATVRIGVAVNHSRKNQQTGDWDESTSFLNIVAFRDLAENAAESLQKGSRVLVTGRLEVREYQTQEGEKRQSVEVIADEIGPSLRWATATVSKSDRRGPDGGNAGGGGGGGGGYDNRGGGGGGNAGGSAGGNQQASDGYNYDEEPF